ncbi:hypothetical protein Gpo141_00003932 [Globisporangium polare]
MRLPATIILVLTLPLLWLAGVLFTPASEAGGVLALSVADAILAHIRPWVYLTAGFYHPYLLQLVVVLPLAFGLAKRVEPELGAANLGRMLVFANTMASFVLFVELFSLYIIFRDPVYLNTSLSGFAGGITALLVAFMKPTPLAAAPIFPGLKLRFYPLAATLAFSFLSLVGLSSTTPALRAAFIGAGPFSMLGGYFGWYYLRFLNKNHDQTRGDTSEEFALVVLLPDVLTPVVGPLTNFSFSVVKLCGYFKNRSDKPASILPVVSEANDDPIAERRKARAMKALDEKLAKLAHARDDSGTTPLADATASSSST